jgi:hypothetical protein
MPEDTEEAPHLVQRLPTRARGGLHRQLGTIGRIVHGEGGPVG